MAMAPAGLAAMVVHMVATDGEWPVGGIHGHTVAHHDLTSCLTGFQMVPYMGIHCNASLKVVPVVYGEPNGRYRSTPPHDLSTP